MLAIIISILTAFILMISGTFVSLYDNVVKLFDREPPVTYFKTENVRAKYGEAVRATEKYANYGFDDVKAEPLADISFDNIGDLSELNAEGIGISNADGAGLVTGRFGLRKALEFSTADTHITLPDLGETVVLLSQQKPKFTVDIDINLDEFDLTAAEAKATYQEIQDYVFKKYKLKVSHLYIAQVKQKYGIIERKNYNLPKNEHSRQPQCPPEKEKAITEALKYFKMIP